MMRLNDLRIRTKVTGSFLVLALLCALAGGSGILTTRQVGSEGFLVGERLAPLADAAMEIKLTATQAHLIFEEIMAGDDGEDIAAVWELLADSRFYANAILSGGQNAEGTFFRTEDAEVRALVEEVLRQIDSFENLARARYATLAMDPGVGTGADERFDGLYDKLVADIAAIAAVEALSGDATIHRLVGEARYSLAHGHLLVAEILGGDAGEDINEALDSFRAARAAVAGLPVEGGQDILAGIDELSALARERYDAANSTEGAGSAADIAFDAAFEVLMAKADAAEEAIHETMATGLAMLSHHTGQGTLILLGIAGTALGLALMFIVILSRAVSGRIGKLSGVMERLADGDFTAEVPNAADADEIGVMAKTVQIFKANSVEARRLEQVQAADRDIQARRAGVVEDACSSFDVSASDLLKALDEACGEMSAAAKSLSENAEETSALAGTATNSALAASSNVQTIAASAAQLSQSIRRIAGEVTQSNSLTEKAVNDIDQATGEVRGLNEAASRIGDVLAMIQDIAAQTNLLALNATIEAARAGEAGKGFAVVANEVKALANQTARATDEISGQITSMQAATGAAVAAIGAIQDSVGKLARNSGTIARAVEEQSAATDEMAENIREASDSTQAVTSTMQGVSARAEDTGNAASRMHNVVAALVDRTSAMEKQITNFLHQVRA